MNRRSAVLVAAVALASLAPIAASNRPGSRRLRGSPHFDSAHHLEVAAVVRFPFLGCGPTDARRPRPFRAAVANLELDAIALAQHVNALAPDGAGMKEHLFA